MQVFLILATMIFLHLFADYQLQGVLARMKQRRWWQSNVPKSADEAPDQSKYDNDYKAALLAHSFEWAFLMMLPLLHDIYYKVWDFERESVVAVVAYAALLALNTAQHSIIDHLKANRRTINLVEDQVLHLAQVVATWCLFYGATWRP